MNLTHLAEIRNKEYRHGLVAAQIDVDLPLQLRALRRQRGWSQPELAERTGMKQPRFPLMERPGGARFTLETLRRLAEAFDVALIVRFGAFSELLSWSERFSPDAFIVPSFEDEIGGLEDQVDARKPIDEFAPTTLISQAQAPVARNSPETLPVDAWRPRAPNNAIGLNAVVSIDRIRDDLERRKGPSLDGMLLAQAASQ